MLIVLRSLWEEIYPLDEQYNFVGLLALGRPYVPDSAAVSEATQSGGGVVRHRKRRRRVGDFDSEPTWKLPVYKIGQAQLNDDDEILALLVA